MNVRSPLLELGFTKQEVRQLSQSLDLVTWDKPALPCLASRIPYGQEVTPTKLANIEAAEEVLWEEGFTVFRVRHYGNLARLEIGEDEWNRFDEPALRDRVFEAIRSRGFKSVELDPQPYRRGSLNDELHAEGHGISLNSPVQIRLPTDS